MKRIVVFGFLFFIIAAVWFISSNNFITVSAVPFGLPKGTKIAVGEKAKFPKPPTDVEENLRRANDLRIAGALKASYNDYETILLKYPDLPAALFGAAYSIIAPDSVSAKDIEQVKKIIESLSLQKPNSVWIKLLLTFSMEHEGSLNYALDMAAELAKESPAFSEARLRYANLLLKTEQAVKAIDEARAAISISAGSDVRAYVNLAFALHKIGNISECNELIEYALPRFPSQVELLLLHGYLSEYAREFDKAQDSYKKILVLRPGDINAINAMATLGEKSMPTENSARQTKTTVSLKEQARESAKIILPLVEEYPENLPLREALGKIYLRARLMKEAYKQFSEIYAQDFEYPGIRELMKAASEDVSYISDNSQFIIDNNLADSLAKTYTEMRDSENLEHDELGRYLVHYNSTFKDFFSKYSITRFKRVDEKTFSETYVLNSLNYNNIIYFDQDEKFYASRVVITGETNKNSYSYIKDIFRYFLKKEYETLGEGNFIEATKCAGGEWSGTIWTSRDNFEILMQKTNDTHRVFILRLHAKRFSDTGNICSYVDMALGKAKKPK